MRKAAFVIVLGRVMQPALLGGYLVLTVPDLIDLGKNGQQLQPRIAFQNGGVLLHLAAEFQNGRHDGLDIALH